MSAFGLNRFAASYAAAVCAAGTRIADKPVSCVDRLVSDLWKWGGAKELSVSFRFLYPFVGGSAESNSFNLADPSVGRIEWVGNVTHSPNGITGDGTTALGKTNVTLAGISVADSFVSFGAYSRTSATGVYADISNYQQAPEIPGLLIYSRYTDGLARYYVGTGMSVAVGNSLGLFTGMRVNNAAFYGYRNGVALISATTGYVAVDPPIPFCLLARPTGTPGVFGTMSPRNLAFAFLTNTGIVSSTAKQLELYQYVQKFQTALGRQV